MTGRPANAQPLRDLALLRRVRDRSGRAPQPPGARTVVEMTPKGTCAGTLLTTTTDLDCTVEVLQAGGAEVVLGADRAAVRRPRLRRARPRRQPDPRPAAPLSPAVSAMRCPDGTPEQPVHDAGGGCPDEAGPDRPMEAR